MKNKLIAALLALSLILTLTACGEPDPEPQAPDNRPTPEQNAPEQPTVNDPPSNENEPQTQDLDNTPSDGTFEGDINGYGVWVYHNNRFEGYFTDGVPNGEGVLYAAYECNGSHDGGNRHVTLVAIQGTFVNGLAHGMITYTLYMCNDMIQIFNIEMDMGYPAKPNEPITAVNADHTIILGEDDLMAVPPFVDNVYTDPNIAPPDVSNLPTVPDTPTTPDSGNNNTPSQSGTFTLTFDGNGGKFLDHRSNEVTTTTISITPNSDEMLLGYSPSREGYNFDGWFIDGDRSKPFDFVDTSKITSDLTIIATWN
jgi:uncharacterized repeat protein (TIGR02543 family)